MKWLILLWVVACVALADEETYSDRYDDIDIDEILANRKLLVPYLKCVLEQGRCTPEGKELKLHIKEAMQTSCVKCTDKQRKSARRVVNYVKINEAEFWEQLKTKYDPGDKYKSTYEAFLARDD